MSDYKLIDITRLTKFKEKLLGILTYSSPIASTSSTSIEFIDTVSQSNGKISASKKKVSTFTGGNTTGLVPAPGAGASGKFLGSDGKWSKPTGTTYSNYTYSSTTKAGAAGLVPQPGTGDVGKFLKGGSGWSDLPTASTATNGAGIVALSNSTNSTSTTIAATSKAVNDVYTAAVNAASTAGTNAGKAAASSYATAAKNSADSASTYATNAKNSAASAASAADTAVTNKINALTGSTTDSTETSTTFISSISQTKGVVTATKKTLPTASTTTAGIVQLINSTGSTSTTTAATPNSVTQAINGLTGSVTDSSATETSTTFISSISQTKGVVTATKKKLPTFAGSSQPGIVSASEGLSENYLLNATGGWTAIDEELDATSTNPVQNKTLYNLETYHTLNEHQGAYIIDDGLNNVSVKTPIKLFFNEDLGGNFDKLLIFPSLKNYPRSVYTTDEGYFTKTILGHGDEPRETVGTNLNFLKPHDVLTSFDTKAIYTKVCFKKHTSLEIFLDSKAGSFEIVGNPIVGRYKYNYEYPTSPSWNITAYAIVYASGLKIQWGNFTNHSASDNAKEETYFPVKFDHTPSMSFSYNNTNDNVARNDIPYAVNNQKWKINSDYEKNNGTWMAIGY